MMQGNYSSLETYARDVDHWQRDVVQHPTSKWPCSTVSRALSCIAALGIVLFHPQSISLWSADPALSAAAVAGTAIPPEILAAAQHQNVPLSSIKKQGDQWVACVVQAGSGESCLVLGRVTRESLPDSGAAIVRQLDNLHVGDAVQIQQYGEPLRELALLHASSRSPAVTGETSRVGHFVVNQANDFSFQLLPGAEARVTVKGHGQREMIDTLPRYRRESPLVVRTKDFRFVQEYIDSHPAEPFLVLVTVPALCEPCRQMDRVIQQTLASNKPKAIGIKTFILEYFNFIDAEREVLGRGALFPTTMVYAPTVQPRTVVRRLIGSTQGYSSDELSRTLRGKLKRGAPHTVGRGFISQDLLTELIRTE